MELEAVLFIHILITLHMYPFITTLKWRELEYLFKFEWLFIYNILEAKVKASNYLVIIVTGTCILSTLFGKIPWNRNDFSNSLFINIKNKK